MVFRPADHPLPPSRGRTGFELHADDRCTYVGISRDDRSTTTNGTWDFDERGQTLSLNFPDGTKQVFTVAYVARDKLVVKK